jgi:hypothetical protein
VAGHQQLTRTWWDRRARFELFISEAVLQEVMRGDPAAAKERAEALEGIPVLRVHPTAESLATSFTAESAAVHGMDFLLTWNCTHIANAVIRPQDEGLCWRAGHRPPVICTPFELLEEES